MEYGQIVFNLYSELIVRVLEENPEGIVVNGVRLNNIRYSDDTAFITTLQDGAQLVFQWKPQAKAGAWVSAVNTRISKEMYGFQTILLKCPEALHFGNSCILKQL